MKTLILTIGHNTPDGRTWSAQDVRAAFEDVTGCDAYTAIPCAGMWRGEAEASTRIEVCALDDAEASRLAGLVPALAAALLQQCIMAEVRECAVMFVEAAAAGEIAATA